MGPLLSPPTMSHVRLTTVALLLLFPTESHAQSSMPAGSPGRFTMQPADGGILRMDTQTGVLSMCRQGSGGWACTILPDDRVAVTDEIERLKSENAELKSAIKRLEDIAGLPAEPGSKPKSTAGLPTEKELDEAMSYVQRMLKKFKDKVREFEGTDGKKGTQL
jgi:hypothetical protein